MLFRKPSRIPILVAQEQEEVDLDWLQSLWKNIWRTPSDLPSDSGQGLIDKPYQLGAIHGEALSHSCQSDRSDLQTHANRSLLQDADIQYPLKWWHLALVSLGLISTPQSPVHRGTALWPTPWVIWIQGGRDDGFPSSWKPALSTGFPGNQTSQNQCFGNLPYALTMCQSMLAFSIK